MRPKCCSASSSVGAISAACSLIRSRAQQQARQSRSCHCRRHPAPAAASDARGRDRPRFTPDTLLRPRQPERSAASRRAQIHGVQRRGAVALPRDPGLPQSDAVQSVRRTRDAARPDGCARRGPRVRVRWRLMQPLQRRRKRRATRSAAPRWHIGLIDRRQRAPDPLAQPRLRHAGGRRIDRRQRGGQRLALSDRTNARMHHLHPGQPATRHTEGAHALADRSCFTCEG